MNELMLIFIGLAVVRSIMKTFEDTENIHRKIGSVLVAISMCWSFYHLLFNCATITF